MISAPVSLASDNPLTVLFPGFESELGSVRSFLGAMLLGTVFSTMYRLYGLSVHQTYRYFQTYPNDIYLLKGLVVVLCALDTVYTALSIDACYFYMVTNYFNPIGIQVVHISVKAYLPLTGAISTLTQLFYVRRVYLFGAGHKLVLIAVAVFMLGKIGFLIATCIKGFQAADLQSFLSFSRIVSSGSFGCDLFTDTILTVALVVPLLRSRTGFQRSDNVIKTIVLYTVNTGLATSIIAILVFIFSLAAPHTFVYGTLSIVGSKVYCNAVMAVLNSRQGLSARMGCEVNTSRPEGQRGKASSQETPTGSWFAPQRSRISVSLPSPRGIDIVGDTIPEGSSGGTTTEADESDKV